MTEHLIDHKYTVQEIEQMRDDLDIILFPITWISADSGVGGSWRAGEREDMIERQLRTYMMAGVRPEEIRQRAIEANARSEAQRESLRTDGQQSP